MEQYVPECIGTVPAADEAEMIALKPKLASFSSASASADEASHSGTAACSISGLPHSPPRCCSSLL